MGVIFMMFLYLFRVIDMQPKMIIRVGRSVVERAFMSFVRSLAEWLEFGAASWHFSPRSLTD